MKKFIMGMIVGICITLPASLYAAENVSKIEAYLNPDVKIEINGEALALEKTPIIFEQTTYLPLREVGEEVMGMTVGWDDTTQTVTMESTIDESQIWPTNDVTPTTVETTGGEKVKTKEDVKFRTEYKELLTIDHPPLDEMSIADIASKISPIESEIDFFNRYITLSEETGDEEKYKPYIVERFKEELPKLQEALTYWQGLKDQKEAQLKAEQEAVTE